MTRRMSYVVTRRMSYVVTRRMSYAATNAATITLESVSLRQVSPMGGSRPENSWCPVSPKRHEVAELLIIHKMRMRGINCNI